MKTVILAVTLFLLTAILVWWYPALTAFAWTPPGQTAPDPRTPSARPQVEVVFVLDTTGSMGGLIQSAKEKIWSIASTLASAQPAPEIRMGLVAFRDRGDEYVTRVFDLSPDLDQMYVQLMNFRADGGGDGPESVNRALLDSIREMSWSQDTAVYQAVFLVGDAPPHEDYADEPQYPEIMELARARGIVVNSIRCGNNPATASAWRQIAALAGGQFFSVDQKGGALAIATPFDQRLAELSRELDGTRLTYGDAAALAEGERRAEFTSKLHAEASTSAQARRATFLARAQADTNLFGEQDLLADLENGSADLASLPAASLPEPLQALPAAERAGYVATLRARRQALTEVLKQVSTERDAFLKQAVAERPAAASSLDMQLFDVLREQAGGKGLALAEPAL